MTYTGSFLEASVIHTRRFEVSKLPRELALTGFLVLRRQPDHFEPHWCVLLPCALGA